MPYSGRIFRHFGRKMNLYHCDLTLKHVAELLPEMGVNVLICFDPNTDIGYFKDKIGDRVCLIGNLKPLLLLNGTPEEVKAECKRLIERAGPGGGYILAPGGELGYGTPAENIEAMLDAAQEYGRTG